MKQREPRLTRRERQAVHGKGPSSNKPASGAGGGLDPSMYPTSDEPGPDLAPGSHLHCVACGRHLDTVGEARARKARGERNKFWMAVKCGHGSTFYACVGCAPKAMELLGEHDRTGAEVKMATPWH